MCLYHRTFFRVVAAEDTHLKGHCLGYGLVNVLVSMTLGIVILAIALQWYHVLKISNFSEKNKKEILDIGRISFQFIRQDLQASGYCGCRTQDHNFPIRRNFEEVGVPYKFLKTDSKVFGFEAVPGVCQQHIPQKFCNNIKQNSDVLVIYNIPQKIHFLTRAMINPEDAICIQAGGYIQKNAMVLISDTQQGDFFIANDVRDEIIFHQSGENSAAVFSKCYAEGTEVTELQTVAYYLGVPEHRSTALLGTYSLFRSDIRQKAEEIVEGVVNFSVEYGFLKPGDSDIDNAREEFQYHAAAQVKPEQWALVRMVRLKIETKGEVYRGIPQKNYTWEYAFAIRNGHRVNPGIGVAFCHFTHCDS